MRFDQLPKYLSWGSYSVNCDFKYLDKMLADYTEHERLELVPDFQRGHVWTEEQQIAYVEHILMEGRSGRDILFNCPVWMGGSPHSAKRDHEHMVLVDGLQRITAVQRYMRDEIPAFGVFHKDMEGNMRTLMVSFTFHINNLPTRADVLEWYLQINGGGTPHSKEELDRVRGLLEAEKEKAK